jgi:RNA polymerase sigma-70 factor (ECF subfamily)
VAWAIYFAARAHVYALTSVKQREAQVTDDELMVRGGAGDDEAFRALVERWQGRLLGFLTRSLGSRVEAEDLVQETFVKVFQGAADYQQEGRFASWLFKIAGNLLRSRIRRRKIVRFISFDPAEHDVAEAPHGEQELRQRELREALAKALDSLPKRQQAAFVLRYDAQLSQAEIATQLQTTVSAVETLLHRAKLALREQMGEWL